MRKIYFGSALATLIVLLPCAFLVASKKPTKQLSPKQKQLLAKIEQRLQKFRTAVRTILNTLLSATKSEYKRELSQINTQTETIILTARSIQAELQKKPNSSMNQKQARVLIESWNKFYTDLFRLIENRAGRNVKALNEIRKDNKPVEPLIPELRTFLGILTAQFALLENDAFRACEKQMREFITFATSEAMKKSLSEKENIEYQALQSKMSAVVILQKECFEALLQLSNTLMTYATDPEIDAVSELLARPALFAFIEQLIGKTKTDTNGLLSQFTSRFFSPDTSKTNSAKIILMHGTLSTLKMEEQKQKQQQRFREELEEEIAYQKQVQKHVESKKEHEKKWAAVRKQQEEELQREEEKKRIQQQNDLIQNLVAPIKSATAQLENRIQEIEKWLMESPVRTRYINGSFPFTTAEGLLTQYVSELETAQNAFKYAKEYKQDKNYGAILNALNNLKDRCFDLLIFWTSYIQKAFLARDQPLSEKERRALISFQNSFSARFGVTKHGNIFRYIKDLYPEEENFIGQVQGKFVTVMDSLLNPQE
jgi:hypothetical protein